MKVILELFYISNDIGEFIKTLHLLHPHLLLNDIAASESAAANNWPKRLNEKPNEQIDRRLFVANKRRGERLISVQELCNRTGWDSITVFERASSGRIPGAVWDRTLRFKEEEVEAWLQLISVSELEDALNELEQQGIIRSFLDTKGERRYYALPQRLQ